jgi:hypothetical protein
VRLLGWSGRWDGLPAAHAAALAFDLGTALLLWLLGRRLRSDGLGRLLAYLWLAFPFTLLVTNSGSNDALVSLLVVAALLGASQPATRGMLAALAGLTKFAPLALAPVFATYGAARGRPRVVLVTLAAFALTVALVLAPLAGELGVAWRQTLGFQAGRSSPFSIWGWYGLPGWAQSAAQGLAVLLAVGLAFVPRRRDPAVLAAVAAAILIALQLTVEHWFYLYLVWFAPLVWVALLTPAAAPGAALARSHPPAVADPATP